jgi:hypothetical protein
MNLLKIGLFKLYFKIQLLLIEILNYKKNSSNCYFKEYSLFSELYTLYLND